jgi:hypothetical protein
MTFRITGLLFAAASVVVHGYAATSIQSDERQQFIENYCLECHGPDKQKGDFRLDNFAYDLTDINVREQWDKVFDNVEFEDMPEEEAKHQPTTEERAAFLAILQADMLTADQTAPVGGTTIRRLNRIEYVNTINDLIKIRAFRLPNSFPADSSELDFDTMPDGLFLSPALLDAYMETATNVADLLIPLPDPVQITRSSEAANIGVDQSRKWTVEGDSAVYLTGVNTSPWSGGIWVEDFTAPIPGMYKVRIFANAQADHGADSKPLRFSFHPSNPDHYEISRRALNRDHPRVASVEVPNTHPGWIECLVPLEQGENAYAFCENRFTEPPPPYATKQEVNLQYTNAKASEAATLRVEYMEITGPVSPLPRQLAFLNHQVPSAESDYLKSVLLPFAERAYRRPLTQDEADSLIASSLASIDNKTHPVYAIHYGIRRVLTSPAFLYRENKPGPMGDYDLASRLSYFLWSTPPDEILLSLAGRGKLTSPETLDSQVVRMVEDPRSQNFVTHFAGQWLGNRSVENLMVCDVRYQWSEMIRYGMIRSTELFMEDILRENLPITTFIDSEFIYANEPMLEAWGIPVQTSIATHEANFRHYAGYPEPDRMFVDSSNLKKAGVRGGVLGLPSVLAATSDGVESSPILRGVWILENLFGTPPPPPPENVPAIDVDISDSNTIREILTAHKNNESCAKCHRDIDPLGLALENYDAIGGWRNFYQDDYQPTGNNSPEVADPTRTMVDASGTLPDGTNLQGPNDIKDYLMAHKDLFTRCLTTKLFEYGAGRKASVGDRRVLEQIVQEEPADGYKFKDLIVKLVQSEVFQTK